jgi:methylenetetrahydrofolate dehydrogenase (NADP+)/methenyltetrahydrofolate cyclohydrolase
MKIRACERVGILSKRIALATETSTDALLEVIETLNQDNEVYGILLQHPVPSQIDERRCFDSILASKDVDGVGCLGFGRMSMGVHAWGSATPAGIMRLLEHYRLPLSGKHAVVVGRSPILGKPMAMMLLAANCTVTVCHSHTVNVDEIIQSGDIVVAALGKPRWVKSEWLRKGVIAIDAGYHAQGCGDMDLIRIDSIASAYTPVPGGVGPMTINTLISQTVDAAEQASLKLHGD